MTTVSVQRPVTSFSGLAGIAGPLMFTASALIHSLASPEHSLLRDPISALAAGRAGAIQDVTFIVTGALFLVFSWGIWRELPHRRGVDIAGISLALTGAGLVAAGVFPATDAAGSFTPDRPAHFVSALVVFAGAGVANLALAGRLEKDPAWRPLSQTIRSAGVALIVLFVVIGALARAEGAPLHEYLGLFQWGYLAVWFPTLIVLGRRLLEQGAGAGR